MAIIVEEERNRSNTTSMLGWVVIIGIIVVAGYYIFIAAPEPTVVTPPPGFSDIGPIAGISFNPESVLNSPGFQSLRPYIPEPTSTGPASVGKTNPFSP